jgi:hypothetical protein
MPSVPILDFRPPASFRQLPHAAFVLALCLGTTSAEWESDRPGVMRFGAGWLWGWA